MELRINTYKWLIAERATEAAEKGWIESAARDQILAALEANELTIGFVGKMKMGKSSVINAWIFEDDKLPTSPKPMTATLTCVRYGEQELTTVTTLTEADFEEIRQTKELDADAHPESAGRIETARELYEAIMRIENYTDMFGKQMEISLDDYEAYIGAEGKLSAMAKMVTITLPREELRGVTIVDTPGCNDPVSSRDDITFNFLSSANVIVLVQDPYSAFDLTDMYLLESQISKAGVGKMLIAVNRFDMLGNVSWEQELDKKIAKKEEIVAGTDNEIVKELLRDCPQVPVSAVMALIGYVKRKGSEALAGNKQLNFFYSKLPRRFPELQTPDDYIQKSGIAALGAAIDRMVADEKASILLESPLLKLRDMLLAAQQTRKDQIEDREAKIKQLNMKIPDLEKAKEEYNVFVKKLFERFAISPLENNLLDSVNAALRKMQGDRTDLMMRITPKAYPDPGWFDKTQRKLNHDRFLNLYFEMDQKIRSTMDNLNDNLRTIVVNEINAINVYLRDNLPRREENVYDSFLAQLKNSLNVKLQNINVSVKMKQLAIPKYSDFKRQTASSYYRQVFILSYTDDYLSGFLDEFRTFVDGLPDVLKNCSLNLINEQREIFDASNNTDKVKELIGRYTEEIKTLNKEISAIDAVLRELNTITIQK